MLKELLIEYFRWVGRSGHPQQLGRRLGVGICAVALVVGIMWQIIVWIGLLFN